MNDIVKALNGKAFTESQIVCLEFDKLHKHTLESIERIVKDLTVENLAVRNYFIETTFKNDRNRDYKNYLMTRDGFALLAMGFTGRKALLFKVKFIDAFNRMEAELKRQSILEISSKETRKTLTDKIKDSGENERMKGHAYSTYTKLAYKIIGIKYKKPAVGRFRDTLELEEVERLEKVEGMMKALVDAGQQYQEVKETINNIFGEKQIKE